MSNHGERDLKASIRELAVALERGLEDHPAPRELQDFVAGDLSGEERERIESHLAICRHCTRVALDLAEPTELEPVKRGELLTERELAVQRERFRKAAGISRRRRFPVPKVLAAVLIAAVLGFAGWALYRGMTQPQGDAVLVDLSPADQVLRGPKESVRLPDWAGSVVLVLNLVDPVPVYPEYHAEILAADGHLVWDDSVRQKDDTFVVVAPRRHLLPGAYRIRLLGPQKTEVAVYEFLIQP